MTVTVKYSKHDEDDNGKPKEITRRRHRHHHHHHDDVHAIARQKYIHGRYRRVDTYFECLLSICSLHNESGNIWTHIIGAAFIFTLFLLEGYLELLGKGDLVMSIAFYGGACQCLVCSVIGHTMLAHKDASVACRCMWLDYIGILMCLYGSFSYLIYYALYFHPFIQITYIIILTGLYGVALILLCSPYFNRGNVRVYRVVLFLLVGVVSTLFSFHSFHINGGQEQMDRIVPTKYFYYEVASYLTGVVIYLWRIPERWFPGKVDLLVNSHQIWHVLIVCGCYFHHSAMKVLVKSRIEKS